MQINHEQALDAFIKCLNVIIARMRDLPPMPDDAVIDYWEEKQIKKWDEFFRRKEG